MSDVGGRRMDVSYKYGALPDRSRSYAGGMTVVHEIDELKCPGGLAHAGQAHSKRLDQRRQEVDPRA